MDAQGIRPALRTRLARFRRRLWHWLWRLAFAWLAVTVLAVVALRFVPPPVSTVMIERWASAQRHGREFRLDYRWRSRDHLARALPQAVVAAEDQRFFTHHGWDREAIPDALADARQGKRLRGASTISQQVAKNLFLWTGRSWVRKGLEAWFTFWLELLWPKERILEVYLNIAEWGEGIFGAEAACRRHFAVGADAIDRARDARLAAVLPNPRRLHADRPSAYVLRRQREILRQMDQLTGSPYTEPLRDW